jgi:hypothetical protein
VAVAAVEGDKAWADEIDLEVAVVGVIAGVAPLMSGIDGRAGWRDQAARIAATGSMEAELHQFAEVAAVEVWSPAGCLGCVKHTPSRSAAAAWALEPVPCLVASRIQGVAAQVLVELVIAVEAGSSEGSAAAQGSAETAVLEAAGRSPA